MESIPSTKGTWAMRAVTSGCLAAVTSTCPPLNEDPRYNYQPVTWDPDTLSSRGSPERHGVDLFGESVMTGQLTGPVMTDVSSADGIIRAGGVDYLRLAAGQAGTTFMLEITGEAGSDLRLRIVREK